MMAAKHGKSVTTAALDVCGPFIFANLIRPIRIMRNKVSSRPSFDHERGRRQKLPGICNGAHASSHDVWVNPDNTDHLIDVLTVAFGIPKRRQYLVEGITFPLAILY